MSVSVEIAGRTAELHAPGFLWLADSRLLCAADLHLEKGSFFHRFGSVLPPYDTRETLHLLEQGVAQFLPDRFIALGDSFHDSQGAQRLSLDETVQLNALVYRVPEWVWVAGNHDPAIAGEIAGLRQPSARDGKLVFRHKATLHQEAQISGHYHPKATLRPAGHRISTPCFVQAGEKLILPAFGSFTGGMDVDSAILQAIMPPLNRRIFAVHGQNVYPV
jgi:uncharacterized protein